MNWKAKLNLLEQNEDFDVAIFFMKKVIKENPDDVDAYIYTLFRLLYTIVEGPCYFSNVSESQVSDIKQQYYDAKDAEYAILALQYFQEGRRRFSENAEFLFYIGSIAGMSEWYFGIDRKDYEDMLEKAMHLDPDNLLYRDVYYSNLIGSPRESDKMAVVEYARAVLDEHSSIKKALEAKGAIGKYLLMLTTNWSRDVLEKHDPVL